MKYNNKYIFASVFICSILFLHFYLQYTAEKLPEKYTAVIVEPREHKALSFVLHNFLENLSNDWNIIIMHGNKNEQYLENIINNELKEHNHRITQVNLGVDNLSIPEYSKLFYSEDFYNHIPTETFLIFQTDSMICENGKDLINEYLNYDYVGAPWKNEPVYSDDGVGNGGLSLRKKSKMLEKIRNNIHKIHECAFHKDYEDMFFANNKCGYLNKPNAEEAKFFSNEGIFTDKSFGVHKPWSHFSDSEINEKQRACKGLDKLIELNN